MNSVSEDNQNRLILMYNRQVSDLYGAVRIIKGNLDNQITSNPFIISKTVSGREIVYGSIVASIEKSVLIISQYVDQQRNALEDWFTERGLPIPKPQYQDGYAVVPFPESEPGEHFIHDRELETEDTILLLSIHLRTLIETFSGKFRHRIPLYGYENQALGEASLKDIYDRLMHYRYFVIRDGYMIDLISHDGALDPKNFFGSKVRVSDFFDGVLDTINGITIKEYVGALLSRLRRLSVKSEPKDIIFVVQNVHSLTKIVADRMVDSRASDFLHIMFDGIVEELFEKTTKPKPGEIMTIPIQFTAPNFKISDDLSNLGIQIDVTVNGKREQIVVGAQEFLKRLAQVYGNDALIPVERRTGPEVG